MASVFKKTVTQRLPSDAKIDGDKVRWKARDGSWRTGKLIKTDLGERVSFKSPVWHCRYRNADGRVIEQSTKCRDKETAKQKLAQLVTLTERVMAGVVSADEAEISQQRFAPIESQLLEYLKYLRTKPGKGKRSSVTVKHVGEYERSCKLVITQCKFKTLADITRDRIRLWVSDCIEERAVRNWSNRTINAHVAAMSAFLNWCVETNRLATNPLIRFHKLDETASKHPRRALTEAELERLLKAARLRPVAEFGREIEKLPKPDGKRTAWTRKQLCFESLEAAYERGCDALKRTPSKLRKLKRLGEERCLIYRVLVTTGLRRGELESILVKNLDFENSTMTLGAENEKAGRGATIALRRDVCEELQQWIVHNKRKPDDAALVVPDKLIRILDRDLIAADIPKVDERGRRIVVHSTRNTLATMLNKAGVAPRVVQEAMRHSDIRLTMQTYTDSSQLDVASALESLPEICSGFAQNSDIGVQMLSSDAQEGDNMDAGSSHEKTAESKEKPSKTAVSSSRGDRIRTYDPLLPNRDLAIPNLPSLNNLDDGENQLAVGFAGMQNLDDLQRQMQLQLEIVKLLGRLEVPQLAVVRDAILKIAPDTE